MTRALTSLEDVEDITSDFEVLYPTFNVDNLGRIKRVNFGDEYAAPGTCAVCVCTLTPDKFFVDLGLTIDDIGAVYLCNICLDELVKVMRCISVESPEYVKLFNGYTNAVAEVGRLRLELKKNRESARNDILADLQRYLGSSISVSSVSTGTMEAQPKDNNAVNELADRRAAANKSGTTANGSAAGPSTEQGSTELLDLTELKNLSF